MACLEQLCALTCRVALHSADHVAQTYSRSAVDACFLCVDAAWCACAGGAAQPTPAVMQELEAHVRGQLEAVTEAGLIDDPTPAPEEDEEDTLESDLAEGLDFGQVMPS